ncbi:hypothetical protein M885DRAFT_464057 [Pelagophyceae sp. CCMP2097]|nr:hypothetical protein M885DRAFT_464057 [Pelagophyceae sp. CCMP2097]
MGNAVGSKHMTIEERPETWRLEVVEAIHQCYLTGNHDFGVNQPALAELFKTVLPDIATNPANTVIWPRFAEYDSGTEVNILEVLAGLAVSCRGTLEGKVQFVFKLFDFDDDGQLNYDEVVMLLFTVLTGAVLMLRRGTLPTDAGLEPLVDEAFLLSSKDVSAKISADEFFDFAKAALTKLCHETGVGSCNSAMALVTAFGLVKPSAAVEGYADELRPEDADTAFLEPATERAS